MYLCKLYTIYCTYVHTYIICSCTWHKLYTVHAYILHKIQKYCTTTHIQIHMNSPVDIKGGSFSNLPPHDILPPGVEHLPQPKVSKCLQFLELVEVLEVLYPLVQLHKLRLMSIQVSGHAIQRHSVVVTKVELVVRNNSARMYIRTVGTVHIT